ncbi:uncharacterized protein [Henckelia pumila]|uniref:uncharacterized protein n=1 Tax=Henckelia pumila TaxID=405737 RepID=UPI003C6DF576
MGWLGDVEIEHVPRKDNKLADALAKLASTISMPNNEARVPIYYFSKWAEAVALKEVKKENFADFIRTHIIYRYGISRKSSMYYAAANGLAETFNKTLCNILKKIIAKSKKDWHERIGEALWAYRTTYRMPTQATPYAIVYGVEAVVPLEQQIPSLRIDIQEGLTEEENARLRLEKLKALDEKKLVGLQRLECYQARLSRAFNKKV